MGSCTSVPSSPSGSNMMHQQTSDTFRVRQLDARYRKKAVMNLRISESDLIIEAKGKRGQPELVASLTPDNSRYSLSRYGLPDIPGCPSILINLKGYDASHTDATYVFFCRNNTTLFDRLQAKIKQVQQNKSFRPVSIRTTPIPTPNQLAAPITPGGGVSANQITFFQEPQFGSLSRAAQQQAQSSDHNYYNDPARDEQTRLLSQSQKTTSQQSFKSSGHFQQTPLSPVPECATNAASASSKPIKLALAPKNRDEMMLRRLESQATTPVGQMPPRLGPFDFPAKPPPRHGHSFYQSPANDYSRTSLSTRSSGQNINQLSARSDCEPLLMSNLSTPSQNMRCGKPSSAEHIYVNTANTNEIAGPRTPSSFNATTGPFTAPAGPHNRQRFFPPMEPIGNRDGGMNYVTVEHNSLSSSNSTPRTPKTPGTSVQYTPVDFEKTDELHKSQQRSIVRTETSKQQQQQDSSSRNRANLLQK